MKKSVSQDAVCSLFFSINIIKTVFNLFKFAKMIKLSLTNDQIDDVCIAQKSNRKMGSGIDLYAASHF